MLVEIHMLQNHTPSNLNRDDTGSPKDCIFGGVRRARISSQCLKRSIRLSPLFSSELEGIDLGLRTRLLPQEIRDLLISRGVSEGMAGIAAAKASGFGNKDGKEQKDSKTAQMMFLSRYDISAVAEVLAEAAEAAVTVEEFKKVSAKDLQAKAQLKGWRPITPDIALFGRMITSEAFRDVEAAAQVAHAISTNKMDHEFDYYTAVDDLQREDPGDDASGAGMIGDVEFNSACYYKYFSLNLDGLVENLAGPKPGEKATQIEQKEHLKALDEARQMATCTASAFLKAAVFSTPSGKQNSFAAHQLPDAILIEVRPDNLPVSYANAFVRPARAHGNADLVEDSVEKLSKHVELLTRKFSLKASTRLWFCTRDAHITGTKDCETLDDLAQELSQAIGLGEAANA